MSSEFFANWFIVDYWRWIALAAFYKVDVYTAYESYLELCALDEHHFSESVRKMARVNKAIADRVLYPMSHSDSIF